MRVRPERGAPATTVSGQGEAKSLLDPTFRGNTIEPFLSSGGAVEFLNLGDDADVNPAGNGVQLVCTAYVPPGRVGFLKELVCCPLVPPELGEPTVPNAWAEYVDGGVPDVHQAVRASERAGYYRTPMAWAAAFDPTQEGGAPAVWSWSLVLLAGNVMSKRPRFDAADPDTWFLAPGGVAVPASAYPSGYPGSAVWSPQVVQVTPEQIFETHLVVSPDTTIALFTRWRQVQFNPTYRVTDLTADPPTSQLVTLPDLVYPLLPSVGRLHGYTQAAATEPASLNAQHGWGG